jgi:hypothetical protein
MSLPDFTTFLPTSTISFSVALIFLRSSLIVLGSLSPKNDFSQASCNS